MRKMIALLLPTILAFSALADVSILSQKKRPPFPIEPGPYNPNESIVLLDSSSGFIFQNPENKYEHIGVLHNQGMDYARTKLALGQHVSQLFEVTEEFMLVNGYQFEGVERDKILMEALLFDKEHDEADDKVKLLVSKGLSVKAAQTAQQIESLCLDGLKKRDQSELINFENEKVSNDEELAEIEKTILLTSASVCRHSSVYTVRNYVNAFGGSNTDEEVIQAIDDITKADMEGAISGGIGGAIAGGPAGALPGALGGALGNSAARWVMSFF